MKTDPNPAVHLQSDTVTLTLGEGNLTKYIQTQTTIVPSLATVALIMSEESSTCFSLDRWTDTVIMGEDNHTEHVLKLHLKITKLSIIIVHGITYLSILSFVVTFTQGK